MEKRGGGGCFVVVNVIIFIYEIELIMKMYVEIIYNI